MASEAEQSVQGTTWPGNDQDQAAMAMANLVE
jgi:hypothetical protein